MGRKRGDQQTEPLVSIIIPLFQHEKFVEDCLTSIAEQTCTDYEVLICDDASTDASFDTARGVIERNDVLRVRCRLLKNETNLGVSATANRMIAMAKGRFVKLIASDDALAPTYLETVVSELEHHPECTAAVTNMLEFGEDEHPPVPDERERYSHKDTPAWANKTSTETFAIECKENTIPAPAVILRREAFERFGLFDETLFAEDWEYWLRLSKAGCRFLWIGKPLVCYRKHSHNSSLFLETMPDYEKRMVRMLQTDMAVRDRYAEEAMGESYLNCRWDMLTHRVYYAYIHHQWEVKKTALALLKHPDYWCRYDTKKRRKYEMHRILWFIKYRCMGR